MEIYTVVLSERAIADLRRVPAYIQRKLMLWVALVHDEGLTAVKRIPGYHDEPLKGKRVGQRSIRLSKVYRAIYESHEDGEIQFVQVEEVNHHEY